MQFISLGPGSECNDIKHLPLCRYRWLNQWDANVSWPYIDIIYRIRSLICLLDYTFSSTRSSCRSGICEPEHLRRTSFQRRLPVIVAHQATLSGIINVWLKLFQSKGPGYAFWARSNHARTARGLLRSDELMYSSPQSEGAVKPSEQRQVTPPDATSQTADFGVIAVSFSCVQVDPVIVSDVERLAVRLTP